MATRVVEKVYGEKEFSALVSTEDGRAFLKAVGTVEEGEEGLVTVKPHPRQARVEEEPSVESAMLAEGDADGDTLVARRASAQLREQLEALRGVGLAELAVRMEFDQDGARLHVNAEAGEVLRRAYEQISAQSGGKPVEVFSGKFSGEETVARLVEVLDDTEAGLRATAETQAHADRVGELTKAVRSVAEAGDKTVVIYLDERAIPHENLHRGAYSLRAALPFSRVTTFTTLSSRADRSGRRRRNWPRITGRATARSSSKSWPASAPKVWRRAATPKT